MTKEETKTLAVVVERLDGLKEDTQEIKSHLKTLNGTVGRHELAIAEATRIAESADRQALKACDKASIEKDKHDKLKEKLYIGAIGILCTAVISLLAACIQRGW
jgi:hypothetical protein